MKSYGYHPNFGEVIPYQIERLPDDPDTQVAVTVRRLIDNAQRDLSNPWVLAAARRCLQLGQNPRLSPARQAINGVWAHIDQSMKFQQDEDQARMLQVVDPRLPDVIEVVIRPADMARLIQSRGTGHEDCDGFTGYGACLLAALGVPVSLCVVSADTEVPDDYSHIYVVAYADGQRIPLDFSHGDYIGWECPNTGRLREWPLFSNYNLCDAVLPVALAIGVFFVAQYFMRKRAL